MRILYGPVDSWRFGRSLGIDPLATREKPCPFSCVYCQYGTTRRFALRRRAYVTESQLRAELDALGDVRADCITFAGLGEPTLATNLPALVATVRERFALPVLLLTGSALIPRDDVRRDLTHFDSVVATLNAPDEALFRQVNRPAPGYPYTLAAIVDGLRHFREAYSGRLIVQVMLIQANRHTATQLAAMTRLLDPDEVQLNTPLQPALGHPLSEQEIHEAARAFRGQPVRTIYGPDAPFHPRMA